MTNRMVPVVAAELRHEGRADRRLADRADSVELVVDRVVGEERHHAVEVLAIERVGEGDDERLQLSSGRASLEAIRQSDFPLNCDPSGFTVGAE